MSLRRDPAAASRALEGTQPLEGHTKAAFRVRERDPLTDKADH